MPRPHVSQIVVGAASAVLLTASVIGLVARDGPEEGAGGSGGGSAEPGAVGIVDFTYDPDPLTVAVGDTVTWTNEDDFAHTVTSKDEGPLDSGDIDGGGTFEATFDTAGTFSYVCAIHPNMNGDVEVMG